MSHGSGSDCPLYGSCIVTKYSLTVHTPVNGDLVGNNGEKKACIRDDGHPNLTMPKDPAKTHN